jgi:thiamine-monophosphate kinase
LHRPQPRIALGLALRGLAHSAIDVSDGLLADLGHILEASEVAATLYQGQLPNTAFNTGVEPALALDSLLSGGDDYELLFTAAEARHTEITALSEQLQLPLTCIGIVDGGQVGDIRLLDNAGNALAFARRGYDHFK